MIPITLDPALARVALCGNGVLTLRRLMWLRDCGAKPMVFSPCPTQELSALAGGSLVMRLPVQTDMAGLAAIWISDYANDIAQPLAQMGRAANVLVNVEDVLDYCDFHTPAIVHRGRLTFAISTGGASPAIATLIRKRLEHAFPAAWAELIDDIGASRLALKAKGATFPELIADATTRLSQSGL